MKYLINDSTLISIAEAIREKNEDVGSLTPGQMPQAILDIHTGETPTETIKLRADGQYDVTNYAVADVDFDQFNQFPISNNPDPADWPRLAEWQPEAIYDDSVEQLFLVYDTELLPEGTVQFVCWYANTTSGNLLIERGYVNDAAAYVSESSTTWNKASKFTEDLSSDHKYMVYRITPVSGHITEFYHARPDESYHTGITATTDYCRLFQPMVEIYGSLPYLEKLYSSTVQRFNSFYLKRFAIKNLVSIKEMTSLFLDAKNLECVDGVETWDTSNVKTFNGTFQGTANLTHIKCKFAITENCTDMTSLFYGAKKLRYIDTSLWTNTSKVTNMNNLFRECYNLEDVDVSVLRGDSVTTFTYMFHSTAKIRVVDLKNFVTPKAAAQTLQTMFAYCDNLQKVDISGLTVSATLLTGMFQYCYSLREINLGNGIITSATTKMDSVFLSCYSLQKINGIENWTSEKCTTFASMFQGCVSLKRLDLSGLKCTVCTTTATMFGDCHRLEEIIFQDGFVGSTVTTLSTMFNACYSLKSVNLKGWDTSKVTSMKTLFQNCRSLNDGIEEVENWDFTACKDMSSMFNQCHSLTRLPNLSNKTFPALTTFASTFAACYKIEEVDMENISAPLCTTIASFLSDCYALKKVTLTGFSLPAATTVAGLLNNCHNLEEAHITGWTATKIVTATTFLYNCYLLRALECDLDLSKITSVSNMFSGCSTLQNVIACPALPKLANSVSASGVITEESIITVFNALPTLTSALKFTIGAVNLNKISATTKAIATNKKWTLA